MAVYNDLGVKNENNPYEKIREENLTKPKKENLNKGAKTEKITAESSRLISISIENSSEPLVIFYGPRNVGKTVALMRLLHFIKTTQSCSFDFENFRDDNDFELAKANFEEGMREIREKPPRTSELNFLLLNIFLKGKPLFKVLEAPGEHFFSMDSPNDLSYPMYLNQLFRSDNKKIFVLFIEENMLNSPSLRERYAHKISILINREIQPKRDRLILLFNKIDQHRDLFQAGRVNEQAVKDKIYRSSSYSEMINAIRNNKGLDEVLFVPFYSGDFVGDQKWNMSENLYPQFLWNAINRQRRKRWKLF